MRFCSNCGKPTMAGLPFRYVDGVFLCKKCADEVEASNKCENCGGNLETKIAAVSYDGKYQISKIKCDDCGVEMWIVEDRPGAPREIDAIV